MAKVIAFLKVWVQTVLLPEVGTWLTRQRLRKAHAAGMVQLGIDIYNGNSDGYDMVTVKAQGIAFVIHKMSQGWAGGPGGWMDWKVLGALARARSAGLAVGGYHWLLRGNGVLQAQLFYQSMVKCGGPRGMIAAVDVELTPWNTALNADAPTLRAFLGEWARLSGGQPIWIYSANWYWGPYMGNPQDLAGNPLWVAQYFQRGSSVGIGTAVGDVTPGYFAPLFGGWLKYAVRQWSSNVIVSGVPSDVDYFPGSLAQLMAYTVPGGSPTPPPPPPGNFNRFSGYATLKLGSRDTRATGVFPDRGAPVATLQNALNIACGFEGTNPNRIPADGDFGGKTNFLVGYFQQTHGLAKDFVAGPATWSALDLALDRKHRTLARARITMPTLPTSLGGDLISRSVWTLVQSGIGLAITQLAGISTWYAVAIAAALTVLKTATIGSRVTIDAVERLLFTAGAASLATVSVNDIHGIPVGYLPLVAALLTALKAYAAGKMPNSNPITGSILEPQDDPGIVQVINPGMPSQEHPPMTQPPVTTPS